MPNPKIESKNILTTSEQILQVGLKDADPLVRQLSAAMMTSNPLDALARVVDSFLNISHEKQSTIFSSFCSEVNSGEHDNELVDIFLSYRQGLSLTEVESWTVTEDDRYWFIDTIEKLFEKLYPEIPLNSYLAYPEMRISDNIPFSTIQRMLEVLKLSLLNREK